MVGKRPAVCARVVVIVPGEQRLQFIGAIAVADDVVEPTIQIIGGGIFCARSQTSRSQYAIRIALVHGGNALNHAIGIKLVDAIRGWHGPARIISHVIAALNQSVEIGSAIKQQVGGAMFPQHIVHRHLRQRCIRRPPRRPFMFCPHQRTAMPEMLKGGIQSFQPHGVGALCEIFQHNALRGPHHVSAGNLELQIRGGDGPVGRSHISGVNMTVPPQVGDAVAPRIDIANGHQPRHQPV